MLDVMKELGRIEDLEPVAGRKGTWQSHAERSGSVFRTLYWLAADKEHLFFTKARNSFDEPLGDVIVRFIRKHESRVMAPDPLVVVDGLKDPRGRFDAIAAVSGEVHQMWAISNSRVNDRSVAIYPIFRCELSGDEDAESLSVIIPRKLAVSSWNRDPAPIAWIRFSDTRTGVRSTNKDFGIDTADTLYEVLSGMRKEGSFAEAKNFRGQLLRVAYRGGALWVTSSKGDEQKIAKKAIVDLAKRFLMQGL